MEGSMRCALISIHVTCEGINRLTMSQKFQDLEEERLDFTKSSLWAYANIASTVCVSDDAVRYTPENISSAILMSL